MFGQSETLIKMNHSRYVLLLKNIIIVLLLVFNYRVVLGVIPVVTLILADIL
jgi:hypothetical protein